MKLADLEPEWVYDGKPRSYRTSADPADFAKAQGILFLCPRHFEKNGGPIGTHMILIWFAGRGAPDECEPLPRWTVAAGSTFNDLTLTPSIDLTRGDPDEWHGFITNGEIR